MVKLSVVATCAVLLSARASGEGAGCSDLAGHPDGLAARAETCSWVDFDAPDCEVARVAASPDVPRPALARAIFDEEYSSHILGGFSYRQRTPVASRFDEAETLSFSLLGILPNPKAPIVAGVDIEFGRYLMLEDFRDGYAVVRAPEERGWVDFDGNVVWPPTY